MIRKTLFFTAILLFSAIQVLQSQKLLKIADLQFETGAFDKAIASYQSYLLENPADWKAIFRIAQIHSLTGAFSEADVWYSKLLNFTNVDADVYLNYGHNQKRLGKISEAKSLYEKYAAFRNETGLHFAQSCDFTLHQMSQPANFETLLLPLNSSASDFGLTFYNNYPVFSSYRQDIMMTELEKEMNKNAQAHRTFLYNEKKQKLSLIKGVTGQFNFIGPVSFNTQSTICTLIESVNSPEIILPYSGKKSTLYIGTLNSQGEITESKAFKYNEIVSNIHSATLAFDGSALYFSSDRSGGYGGYDIYVSYLNDGEWSAPQNLGPIINTEGNEITPYFDNSTLYFASEFHTGMGGFDIFSSTVSKGKWQIPVNMGNGVNSVSDDYFPCMHLNELYFTSNRLGGKGKNDIYKATGIDPVLPVNDLLADAMPKAVSLELLTLEANKGTEVAADVESVSVKSTESAAEAKVVSQTAFELPEFNATKVGSNAVKDADISLAGARRVSMDALAPNYEVFFIQLASMSAVSPNYSPFKALTKYGNIYRVNSNRTVKVRLGYYNDRKEAEDILKIVRANGFKDAFLTYEMLNTSQMELILSSLDGDNYKDNGNFKPPVKDSNIKSVPESNLQYKVRLASYEDPIWFDVNKVKDIGRVEQWTKGNWTIFILAGFNSMDEAKQAQIKAINRGFNTAEVVIDNGGILERLKQN